MPSVPPGQGLKRPGDLTGARLVGEVFARWAHLPDYHFRALGRMALRALDDPNEKHPAAMYWGGREYLARCWPQPFPEGEGAEEEKRRKSVLDTVTVVCKELRAEGAIEIVKGYRPPGPGLRQTFLLTLDNDPTGAIARMRAAKNEARRPRRKAS